MIRPRPARWFEALVARDDATAALTALASTGAVELEARPFADLPAALADVRPLLAEYAELAQRYRAYWPRSGLVPSAFPEPPALALERGVARVRAWAQAAEPLIRERQANAALGGEMELWREVLARMPASPVDFRALAAGSAVRIACLVALPAGGVPELADHTLVRPLEVHGQAYALVVGTPAAVTTLAEQAVAARGRVLPIPAWLGADTATSVATIAARLPALAARNAAIDDELAALARTHALHTALADAERLDWVMRNVRALEAGRHFCWITGWTSVTDRAQLDAVLESSGARALLHFPPPPRGAKAPLLFANPAWVRPFEVFARALGMPAGDEVDPSVLLAVAVPLLFGYMFGDVGQGLVIATIGYALRRRHAVARLFVAGGLAAAAFGLLFGSVFSLHLLPPLWTAPLDRPLAVLVVPIVGGAALLTVGLLLAGLEAYWRHGFARWLGTDAGMVLVYVGLLAGIVASSGFALAAGGALLFVAGHAWHARRASAAFGALGELLERTLQIAINTLSFARVGAFALAHAGLSSAIVALMAAADSRPAAALVLVAGNLVVIALETLVVSIQTTRLVLFEFFTRFLQAGGRVFRPLPAPPSPT